MNKLHLPSLLASLSLGMCFAAEPVQKTSDLKVSVLPTAEAQQGVVVRFENHSDKPLRILRPVDGSQWGWHMPVYALTITDSSGKAIPLGVRCKLSGLYSGLKWPDDYRIQILPGDAYETTVRLCREIPETGSYAVSFTYRYDPTDKSVREFPVIKYPDDLWTGSSSSESVSLHLAK